MKLDAFIQGHILTLPLGVYIFLNIFVIDEVTCMSYETVPCVQKRPMQTDGWPEKDEGMQQDMASEQDMQQAKTVILNWTKDLRAQPEVGSTDIHTWVTSTVRIK